jgi:hypothetical protein
MPNIKRKTTGNYRSGAAIAGAQSMPDIKFKSNGNEWPGRGHRQHTIDA